MLYNTGLAKVLKMALLERILSSAFATRHALQGREFTPLAYLCIHPRGKLANGEAWRTMSPALHHGTD
ncbi:hypothetical protein CapIbe_002385 [Capra ibex]